MSSSLSGISRVIICIGDRKANWSIQVNIHRILKVLIETGCVKLVTCGGATGAAGMDVPDIFGDQALVQRLKSKVGYAYLKAFEMSGQECCFILSEEPFTLWGVEDPELYNLQMRYYQRGKFDDALALQESIIKNFITKTLEKMKQENLSLAVLIAPVADVQQLAQQLGDNQISYMTLEPTAFEPDDPETYIKKLQRLPGKDLDLAELLSLVVDDSVDAESMLLV